MRKAVLVIGALVLGLVPAAALGKGAAPVPRVATLTGANEVPQEGQAGTGNARITLNRVNRRVCWRFTNLSGLGGAPNAAHIHRGGAGVAGPVVVPLGAAFRARGCTVATRRLFTAILARPGRYYVNIHNEAFPGGAVRGQLQRP
jgi:hypothetical protein